jgi:hypothetical protein
MLSQEEVAQQQALLAVYRRTLDHLLVQTAQYGGEVFSPPPVANGIHEAREHIEQTKAILRSNGLIVADHPNDKAPPVPEGDSADDVYPRTSHSHHSELGSLLGTGEKFKEAEDRLGGFPPKRYYNLVSGNDPTGTMAQERE